MEHHGHAQWLVAGHPRTATAVSSVASCVATFSSEPGESATSPAQTEPSEDVRHTAIRRSTVEGHDSARASGKIGSSFGRSTGVDGPEVESLRAPLKLAKEVKGQPGKCR